MSRRLEALRAMATQDVSPAERDIARVKLEAMGQWPPPPRPPAPSAAAAPDPGYPIWPNTAGAVWMRFSYAAGTTTGAAGQGFGTTFTIILG